MIDTPSIVKTTDQLAAAIHLKVPRSEIRNVMGPGLHEIRMALAAQGVAQIGPWFSHHRRITPDAFDFEICVPVAESIAAVGRVKPKQLASTTVARTIYRGPYEGLAAAWGEFETWMAENGHAPAEDLWECYVAGPESSADPAQWCTELNRPLIAQSTTSP